MMLWAERRESGTKDGYNPGPMKRAIWGWLAVAVLATMALGRQGSHIERFQATDIFLTFYKGPPVADPATFHSSQSGRDFESELQSDDDERFCLQSPQLTRSVGVWKGSIEPSYWIRAIARQPDAEAYASEHGQKHRQDSVLVFEAATDGPDAEYVLSWRKQPQIMVLFEAMMKAGFDGATVAGNKLFLVDVKASKKSNATELSKTLGAALEINRGRARLLDAVEMEKTLRLYAALPHSCPVH